MLVGIRFLVRIVGKMCDQGKGEKRQDLLRGMLITSKLASSHRGGQEGKDRSRRRAG